MSNERYYLTTCLKITLERLTCHKKKQSLQATKYHRLISAFLFSLRLTTPAKIKVNVRDVKMC